MLFRSGIMRTMLLLCFCILFIPSHNASINAPAPIIHYDCNMIEIGSVHFMPSTNTISTGDYFKSFQITLTKMNQYGISNYDASFGWRGANIIFITQGQGVGTYSAGILTKTTTDITVGCNIVQLKFSFLTGNYLLIHPDIIATKMIFGAEFHSMTPCLGVDPIPQLSASTCIYLYAYPLPLSGYKRIISIRHLSIYRDDLMSKAIYLDIAIRPLDGLNTNVQLFFGAAGSITEFIINVVSIKTSFLNVRIKRSLQFEFFEETQPQNTVPFVTKINPIANKGYDYNLFIGLKNIVSSDPSSVFHYTVVADSAMKIVNSYYLVGTRAIFRAIVYFGHKSPSTAFVFSDDSQQCQVCPDYCLQCQPNIYNQVECLQCDVNFAPSFDKLSCVCGMTRVASVCDNFLALGLNDCANAVRNGTIIQCNFCSVTQFQTLQNNQCGCKVGYNDLNGDGICEETCGDGIFFDHKCDDGNTNSNDGCSSNCMLESGFTCDANQPTFCSSRMPLSYKIGFVERVLGENKGKIKLNLLNSLNSLPFALLTDNFSPHSTHVRLFIIESQSPYRETEIIETNLLDLTTSKSMILEFSYSFTAEALSARIAIDYARTRYSNYVQQLKWVIDGINSPLIFSDKLATYGTISIMLCVGTALGMIGLFVGVMSPKYIGLESLLTLQLFFYSQMLISDPQKWPIGFMYLKYLKFSSGYNDIFKLSQYVPETIITKKLSHLEIKKTIIENFNINFVILMIAFAAFIFFFVLKYWKEAQLLDQEQKRKQKTINEKEGNSIEINTKDSNSEVKSIKYLISISEKLFWIVNHLSVWMLLPIMVSIAASVMISGDSVEMTSTQTLISEIQPFGHLIALLTIFVIVFICMNNFKNMFLGSETMKKIFHKQEEQTYKKLLVVYLSVTGFIICFCNKVVIANVPFSVLILLLQIIYIIALLMIHPYKQSLRVHSITLLINQCVYLVFLIFINLINFVKDIDEILVLIMGYFITGCCGVLVLLTAVRLYYELRYGEALQKKIQMEREKEEELQKKLQKEKLEKIKKQLESDAKKKQSQKEIKRQRNQFLYENQAKQDEALDVIAWLEKCNWEAEEKEKYFFSKFSQKPMDWLKKNNIDEYHKLMESKKQPQLARQQQKVKNSTDSDYVRLTKGLRKEGEKHIEILQKKLLSHKKRIETDMNYTMQIMKNKGEKFVSKDYRLAD